MTRMSHTTEQREALKMMDWVWQVPILKELIFHIANERHCTPQQGHMFKCLGVRAGVSDYMLPLPRGKYHGFWLELKKDKTSRTTSEQQYWIEKMRINGYQALVAHGHLEAIDYLKDYLETKPYVWDDVFLHGLCGRCPCCDSLAKVHGRRSQSDAR